VDGAQVKFDISARFAPGKAVAVTAVLSPRAGGNDEVVELGVLRNGRHTYGQSVQACAQGCTLNSLRIAGGQGTLDVAGVLTVHSINDVLGTYAQGDASAGAVKSGTAQILTKGTVSLALAGEGEGVELGLSVGGFTITKAAHAHTKHK
jgi:hypothetical protein